jgi:hypothetical protein
MSIMPNRVDAWGASPVREEYDDAWQQTLRDQDDDSWLRTLRDEDDAPLPWGLGAGVDAARSDVPAEPPSVEPQSDAPPIPPLPLEGPPKARPVDEAEHPPEHLRDDAAHLQADDPVEDPAYDQAPDHLHDLAHDLADDLAHDPAQASPPAPHRAFRRPPAERLNRALTDESGFLAEQGEPDDEERIRGTLEPVLRHSTERAKASPVLRPPVQSSDADAGVPVRPAPTSWDDAITGDVVPGKKKRRRRLARARHESAGAEEEYRPPSTSDRSLTLLVVAMLAVLAVLVGAGLWTFWPR